MDENSKYCNNTIFGYTFPNNSDSQNANPSPQPPTGPPLLENRESEFLTEFFNNPDSYHFDPSLSNAPGDAYDEGNNLLGNFTSGWMSSPGVDFMNRTGGGQGQTQFATTRSNERQFGYDPFAQDEEQTMEEEPSQDVYAAARLLHDQQVSHANNHPRDEDERYNGIGFAKHSGQQESSTDARGSTPPLPSFYANTPYNFSAADTLKSLNATVKTSSYPDPDHPNGENGHGGLHHPRGLNFGSDREFHSDNYIAADRNYLDAPLDEYAAMALYKPGDINPENPQPTAKDQSRKRRKRSAKASEVSSDEDEGDEDDETGNPRRKRVSYAAKDREQDREGSSGKGKTGKRYNKALPQTSPGKGGKLSPPATKSQRENLSEEQKRSNHILSEQKRRNVIKQGFEDINRMVPELRTGGFSKSNMLVEAAKFLRQLQEGNEVLRRQLETLDEG